MWFTNSGSEAVRAIAIHTAIRMEDYNSEIFQYETGIKITTDAPAEVMAMIMEKF